MSIRSIRHGYVLETGPRETLLCIEGVTEKVPTKYFPGWEQYQVGDTVYVGGGERVEKVGKSPLEV